MDLQLNDKIALITGSSAGIGFATTVGLAREGAHVILNGRDAERLASAHDLALAAVPGANIRSVVADVSTVAGADSLIEAAPDVDILINNAATFGPQVFADIPDDEWLHEKDTGSLWRAVSPDRS